LAVNIGTHSFYKKKFRKLKIDHISIYTTIVLKIRTIYTVYKIYSLQSIV